MKTLLLISTILLISTTCFADLYVIEFDKTTQKQISSYTLKDDETIGKTENAVVYVSKEEYDLLGHSTNWDKNTQDWLKSTKNSDKLIDAIAIKESEKSELDLLKERIESLETAVIVSGTDNKH